MDVIYGYAPLDLGDPRGSPGIAFKRCSGEIRGRGQLKTSGENHPRPRKSPKFGDGDGDSPFYSFGDTLGMRRAKN